MNHNQRNQANNANQASNLHQSEVTYVDITQGSYPQDPAIINSNRNNENCCGCDNSAM